MRNVLALLLFGLIISEAVHSQSSNTSVKRTLLWPYSLPESKSNGPMDVSAQLEYYFVKERFAGKYVVKLKFRVISIDYVPKHGAYRYKVNGKIYRHDEMHASDGLGMKGFDEVTINNMNIKMHGILGGGVQNAREFNMDTYIGHASDLGEVDENADLNHLSLDHVLSYATSFSYTGGSEEIRARIRNLEKTLNTGNQQTNSFEPEFQELISEFKLASQKGDKSKSNELKNTILEIASHAYPDKIDTIKSIINKVDSDANLTTIKQSNNNETITTSQTNSNAYTNWSYLYQSRPIQMRFKLVKSEEDISYFQVQFRIDHDYDYGVVKGSSMDYSQYFTGFMFCFGYSSLDNEKTIQTSYKINLPYDEVYTVAELMPLKMNFTDGSRRIINEDGIFYTTPRGDMMGFVFSTCAEVITSYRENGYIPRNDCEEPNRLCRYNEEQVIVIN